MTLNAICDMRMCVCYDIGTVIMNIVIVLTYPTL